MKILGDYILDNLNKEKERNIKEREMLLVDFGFVVVVFSFPVVWLMVLVSSLPRCAE